MSSCDVTRCPMCGGVLGDDATACKSCPLSSGCALVCCPTCGYSTVVAERSRLVLWMMSLLKGWQARSPGPPVCLADARPNDRVQVVDLYGLADSDQERLQAYGMLSGSTLHVIQQQPVTVVRVERVEIALEPALARGVRVAVAPHE